MPLLLTSHGVLARAHHLIETNKPIRSGVISAVAGGVGLVAGKRRDAKKVPLIAVGAGATATFLGLTGLGDGLASGGATIIGYRVGVKWDKKKKAKAGKR